MASDNKIKARVSSILFMIGIVVALFFIEFTFAENPPTVEVSDPFPEEMEIKDVVAETNKPSNSSSARNPDPKPKPPAPVNNNNSSEQLTDNTPDNSVSNPFGGQNGGGNNTNGFGQGDEGNEQTGNRRQSSRVRSRSRHHQDQLRKDGAARRAPPVQRAKAERRLAGGVDATRRRDKQPTLRAIRPGVRIAG